MDRSRQASIGAEVRLAGCGLHTGRMQAAILRPAPAGTGIRFRRAGREGGWIPATLDTVTETDGRITLGGETGVSTVEHLLSAAWAAGVDNLDVEVEGSEMPGFDGSALPFFRALADAGVVARAAPRPTLRVRAPLSVRDADAYVVALPASRLTVDCLVRIDARGLGAQAASYDPARDAYEEVIAPARTWGYARDADALRRRGLALGSSLENTLAVGDGGYLNPPRFPNEAARHKVLDLLGDLALLGGDLVGCIVAVRAGHRLHVALAEALRAQGG